MDTQTKEAIIQDYIDGLKLTDIFSKYHTSYKTVVKILDERGINHSRGVKLKGISNTKNMRTLSQEEENLVCETYLQTKKVSECQKAIKAGQDVVRRCLQKNGLYRTQKESVRENPQNQRKYPVKDDYFDIENERMAYLLGLLASDGTVRKDTNEIKLSFSSVDKEFLEKLQKEVGGRPISSYTTQDGFEVSTWEFTSKKIKNKLAEYNIIPQKTFTFSFPMKLSKEYWKDFIRGYFDGDGSISTAGPNAIRFQICSATEDVLKKIIDFFEENDIPRVNIQVTYRNKNPLYYFQYSSTSTRKIYNILYYDNCLCLPRKKKKFEEVKECNLKK